MKKVSDILPYFLLNLKEFYPDNEIKSFAYITIKYFFDMSKSDTIINSEKKLEDMEIIEIKSTISSLKRYEPIQYVFMETEFYGNSFFSISGSLIPRPETEELVDWIIKDNKGTKKHYLDIGTGSGCIIISLSKHLNGSFTGIDVSYDALRVSVANNDRNETDVYFDKFDILKHNLPEGENILDDSIFYEYDVIVSNPPYVLNSEKEQMSDNVLKWEPHLALFVPDEDPLLFYREIAKKSSKALNPDGLLYFEINEKFGKKIVKLLEDFGFVNIELKKDINDKDRMVKAVWK
ncbi:MAG: peptide chain release factor N(5)-glutamine methyltransferase [Flavobacteriales bacterium]|nr:peptide chain release factor N(5)-glutamine methyltransferase [Flavobacteriales bacterium]